MIQRCPKCSAVLQKWSVKHGRHPDGSHCEFGGEILLYSLWDRIANADLPQSCPVCEAREPVMLALVEALESVLRHDHAFGRTHQTWAEKVDKALARAKKLTETEGE